MNFGACTVNVSDDRRFQLSSESPTDSPVPQNGYMYTQPSDFAKGLFRERGRCNSGDGAHFLLLTLLKTTASSIPKFYK